MIMRTIDVRNSVRDEQKEDRHDDCYDDGLQPVCLPDANDVHEKQKSCEAERDRRENRYDSRIDNMVLYI